MEKYRTIRVIGKGSYGQAVLVRRIDEGKMYVMKKIKVTNQDRQQALREGRLLSALDHPNIIAYKESFMVGRNQLCIITDYADGGDLHAFIDKRKSIPGARNKYLSENEILDLFVQICLAIKHVHDRKILHRDIKCQNIFLTRNSVVKLGDFGISKVLNHTLECAATAIGTPYYLSPEICLEKKYNHKSDIWSLGCVLYELTTLKHAFDGRNMKVLENKIIRGSYAPIPTHYSAKLSELISEMLAKNPRERPGINTILHRPVIKDRIKEFLSHQDLQDEFSHTVLHGQHVLRKRSTPLTKPSCDGRFRKKEGQSHARVQSSLPPKPVERKPLGVPARNLPKKKIIRVASGISRKIADKPKKKLEQPRKKTEFAVSQHKSNDQRYRQKQYAVRFVRNKQKAENKRNGNVTRGIQEGRNVEAVERAVAFNAQWQAQREQLFQKILPRRIESGKESVDVRNVKSAASQQDKEPVTIAEATDHKLAANRNRRDVQRAELRDKMRAGREEIRRHKELKKHGSSDEIELFVQTIGEKDFKEVEASSSPEAFMSAHDDKRDTSLELTQVVGEVLAEEGDRGRPDIVSCASERPDQNIEINHGLNIKDPLDDAVTFEVHDIPTTTVDDDMGRVVDHLKSILTGQDNDSTIESEEWTHISDIDADRASDSGPIIDELDEYDLAEAFARQTELQNESSYQNPHEDTVDAWIRPVVQSQGVVAPDGMLKYLESEPLRKGLLCVFSSLKSRTESHLLEEQLKKIFDKDDVSDDEPILFRLVELFKDPGAIES